MRHAVIMAGGSGLRLWPLSRRGRPKQLLRLFGGTTLLRASYERIAALFDPERISVITHQSHLPSVSQELPELAPANLFGEPEGRDTASAIGLAAAVLAQRDPEAVMGIFTADHMITPASRFCEAVELAFGMAEENPDALVILGVKPTRPDTNYGYIALGKKIKDHVWEARKFTEKPRLASAMKYLASGEFYWNSGMFAWRASAILDQLAEHLPKTHDAVREIAACWESASRQQTLERLYPELMRISIDFAVLEKAERVLVVELDAHWVDVGSWPAIEGVIGVDGDGNVNACSDVVHLGSRGNIVVSEEKHLIATVGVDDLVIVHSADATLICTKRDANAIKELLDDVRREYGEKYT